MAACWYSNANKNKLQYDFQHTHYFSGQEITETITALVFSREAEISKTSKNEKMENERNEGRKSTSKYIK